MTNIFQIKRGTTAKRVVYLPAQGELILDTDTKKVYIGDGVTAGGVEINSVDLDASGIAQLTKQNIFTNINVFSGSIFATRPVAVTADKTVVTSIATSFPLAVVQAWQAVPFSTYKLAGDLKTHFGVMAQDIQTAFTAKSLNAADYGLIETVDGILTVRLEECMVLDAYCARISVPAADALTAARNISITGDASWSTTFDGTTNVTGALTLSPSGAAAGTYTKVTVDTKGRVTSGAAMVAADIPALDTSNLTTGTLPVNRGGTGVAAAIQGGILYGATTALGAFTAAGTSGQVLISNGTGAPTWQTLDLTYLPDSAVKKSVKVATTANITLSGLQTIDGVSCVAGDRVLVKNQTTTATNGIYVVSAAAWSRAPDADTISKIAGAIVNADSGTANGGFRFDTDIKTTDTLGTTALTWNRSVDTGMAATVAGAALGVAAVGVSDKYAREDHVHTAPTTVTGNAGTATKLATAHAITLTGGVSGTANFDGSAAISIAATVNNLGVANGIATLDVSGKVPAAQLPSYVDDVLEYATKAAFPATGETGKIYVETTGNTTFRWSGSAYVKITSGEVTSVAGKTGVVTLVKADVGLGSVDNTTDSAKNVLSATKLTTARTINGTTFDGTANITIVDATKAPLASPALTGVPTAPTAATATNNTQLATTAFVQAVNATDTGSSSTALKLKTARTIAIAGAVTGSVSFDGSANATINSVFGDVDLGVL